MAGGRWYPTNVTLADGRVLVFSGFDERTGEINSDVEVYEPGSGTGWQIVSQVDLPLYPRMHMLSSGDVFYSGPSQVTGTFKIATWSWSGIVWSNYGGRHGCMSVLLPSDRDKVMIIGGQSGGVVTEMAERIDLADPLPAWRVTQPMSVPRMNANAVMDEKKVPGVYSVNWNGIDNKGRAVSSGIYYYTIATGGYKQTKKMLLLR
ncbi:MAG: hypothetical protein ACE5IR_15000 [bacterium]